MKQKTLKLLTITLLLAISFAACNEKDEPELCCDCVDEPEPCNFLCKDYDALPDIVYNRYVSGNVDLNRVIFKYSGSREDYFKIMDSLQAMCIKVRIAYPLRTAYSYDPEFLIVEIGNFTKEDVMCLIARWRVLGVDDIYATPVFVSECTNFANCIIPNQIYVRLKQEDDYFLLLDTFQPYNVNTIERRVIPYPLEYIVTINDANQKCSIQIAKELSESGLFHSVLSYIQQVSYY